MTSLSTRIQRRREHRDAQARDRAVARLTLAAAQAPPFELGGGQHYSDPLDRSTKAGHVAACGICGCSVAAPADRPTGDDLGRLDRVRARGYGICDVCTGGLAVHDVAFPAVAAFDLLRVPAGDRARQAILARYTSGRPTGRTPVVHWYADVEKQGASPQRPIAPWSFLRAVDSHRGYLPRNGAEGRPADADAYLWPHDGKLVDAAALPRWPTVLDVLQAERTITARQLHDAEIVPPPARWGDRACWYCGRGGAPRASWERRHGRAWCALAETCRPADAHELQARAAAVGHLLGRPVPFTVVQALHRRGELPPVWWGEIPEGERPEPASEPFAWWTDEARETLLEQVETERERRQRGFLSPADRAALEQARAQAAAQEAEMEAAREEAIAAARSAGEKAGRRAGQRAGRRATQSLIRDAAEAITESITEAVTDATPAPDPPGPQVTYRNPNLNQRRPDGARQPGRVTDNGRNPRRT